MKLLEFGKRTYHLGILLEQTLTSCNKFPAKGIFVKNRSTFQRNKRLSNLNSGKRNETCNLMIPVSHCRIERWATPVTFLIWKTLKFSFRVKETERIQQADRYGWDCTIHQLTLCCIQNGTHKLGILIRRFHLRAVMVFHTKQ